MSLVLESTLRFLIKGLLSPKVVKVCVMIFLLSQEGSFSSLSVGSSVLYQEYGCCLALWNLCNVCLPVGRFPCITVFDQRTVIPFSGQDFVCWCICFLLLCKTQSRLILITFKSLVLYMQCCSYCSALHWNSRELGTSFCAQECRRQDWVIPLAASGVLMGCSNTFPRTSRTSHTKCLRAVLGFPCADP